MKKTKRHRTNLISTIVILVTVGLLVFLSIILYNHTKFEQRFDTLIMFFEHIDSAIARLDTTSEILICIFAMYIARCQIGYPLTFVFIISGIVFETPQAVIINTIGMFFFFTVKYVEGSWIGGGWAGMILSIKHLRFLRDWIQFKGNGNPYVLFVTRLIPSIPLGMVSKYYGSMRYDFVYYSVLSVVGILPRIYIYTKIGSAIHNPFSPQFIILLMIAVLFSGVSILGFNIFYGIRSKQMTQTLLIYSEKEKYKIVL